jgi:hypothetical protein
LRGIGEPDSNGHHQAAHDDHRRRHGQRNQAGPDQQPTGVAGGVCQLRVEQRREPLARRVHPPPREEHEENDRGEGRPPPAGDPTGIALDERQQHGHHAPAEQQRPQQVGVRTTHPDEFHGTQRAASTRATIPIGTLT